MTTHERFEDLEIWKRSMGLVRTTYKLLRNCKDYGLKDQIQRAAVSIPSNISEGYERRSNKEFLYYLNIAKGSCGEYRTQLYLLSDFNYINLDDFRKLKLEAIAISSMITNFMKTRSI